MLKRNPLRTAGIIFIGLALITGAGLFLPNSDPSAFASPKAIEKKTGVDKKRIIQKVLRLQMPFIANEGQIKDRHVQFYAKTFGGASYVTQKGEIVYSFQSVPGPKSPNTRAVNPQSAIPNPQSKGCVLKETVVGGKIAGPIGLDPSETKVNYFIGNDKSKWKTNISTYNSVSLGEIYEGISLSLKAYGKTVEKIFTICPGADPKAIKLKMEGANSLKTNEQGELELESGLGVVRFSKPLAYQEKSGKIENVRVAYHLDKGTYGFRVGDYDKSLPLIIDPVLSYSTYVGDTDDDSGYGIAVDAEGNAYVTGITSSTNFPTTLNAYQAGYGGARDAFVTKLNAEGTALDYSTYLGGEADEWGHGIAVDAAGNAYVAGLTESTDFPTTQNAYQAGYGGGSSDAFVTKLNAEGNELVYSTYLGGNLEDGAEAMAVDAVGNAYVAGFTYSTDFPTTQNAYQGSIAAGGWDAFVTKLNAGGTALDYSTYLGGTGEDRVSGIAVDAAGNAYVAGYTESTNFPTQNAYQADQVWTDAFVTKLNAEGTALAYSTYLGGESVEWVSGIAVDAAGNAYVTGYTYSPDFPTTQNAYQGSNAGYSDAFVTKLNAGGTALAYSTYLGGEADEWGYCIAVDATGNAYVAGITHSAYFPTLNAYQAGYGGGSDAFVTKLNAGGTALDYSTYLGGESVDEAGHGIAVDAAGNAYVAGYTTSTNFPTTQNAYQGSNAGGWDAFVAKIAPVIRYVKTDGSNSNEGTSWSDAFATIQAAIDAASPGYEIWVAEGIYDISLSGQINVDIAVAIYGGFEGTETARDQRDWVNNKTKVDGGDSTRCFHISANAILDGLYINACKATGEGFPDTAGGGIYVDYANPLIINCTFTGNSAEGDGGTIHNYYSNPTISNCEISGNRAEGYGGGMYNFHSSPTVTNCTFADNVGDAGGAMSNYPQSSPTVSNCTFRNNSARAGGGMHNHVGSSPTVTNCTFTGNFAYDDNGGMINHSGSNAILTNCIFTGNSAGKTVGGIQNAGSVVTLTNCTFSGNTAGVDYGGMWDREYSDSTVTNCIFWGNTPNEITVYNSEPTITYSDVQGGWTGTGNIDVDPLFVSPALGDFRLRAGSPCIDTGDNTAITEGITTDFEGETRIFDGNYDATDTVDIGADEYVDTDDDQMADSWEMDYFGDLSHDGTADGDGDGLTDLAEYQNNTNPTLRDTDGDNLLDGHEVNVLGTSPTDPDSDDDLIRDDVDSAPNDPSSGQIPVWGAVTNVQTSSGTQTWFHIFIGDGFMGSLPGDLGNITVKNPSGVTVVSGVGSFTYFPQWKQFWASTTVQQPLGEYTFTVTSGSVTGQGNDVQATNRTLPIPNLGSLSATLTSSTPGFTWDPVTYAGRPLYYRLQISPVSGGNWYESPIEKGITSWTVPDWYFTAGQTYQARLNVFDDGDFKLAQNRAITNWQPFTMGTTLTHSAMPAIDPAGMGVVTWTTGNSTNPLFWVRVIDHDGVASDGSSHHVQVTFPGGGPTHDLYYHDLNRQMHLKTPTSACYSSYINLGGLSVPQGVYTFTVTDPDGNVGEMEEELSGSNLDPPDVTTLSPSSLDEYVTMYVDNVYVNGAPYENFDSYADISELDPNKWINYCGGNSISGGSLEVQNPVSLGGSSCGVSFTNPQSINSMQADITVPTISSNLARGRINGWFFNNGNGDVYAEVSVRQNTVRWMVLESPRSDIRKFNYLLSQDLMAVTPGETIRASISWDKVNKRLDVSVQNLDTLTSVETFYLTPAAYPLVRDTGKGIDTRVTFLVQDTTPTFQFDPVAGANQYNLRIYDWQDDYVIGNLYSSEPSLTVPPGVLEPNTFYKCEIRARDAHNPLIIDNYSKAPNNTFEFYAGAQDDRPYIDLDRTGVQTWNDGLGGLHLSFWVKVHDAQGVPDSIRSVKVAFPSGAVETLYYDAYWALTPTSGIYRTSSFLPIEEGVYTFTVQDWDGNVYSIPEELNPVSIDYPAESSLDPAHNTLVGGIGVGFDWDDVEDSPGVPAAAFYRVEIYDAGYNRIYALDTTDSHYLLAPGFLNEETLYRYRVLTRREFYDQNVDNGSSSPWHPVVSPTILTTPITEGTGSPTIGLENWGAATLHYKNPATGNSKYFLYLEVKVSDTDGVPANIQSVKVTCPAGGTFPDGTTTQELIYDEGISLTEARYRGYISYDKFGDIPVGTYTFEVADFDGHDPAQATDELVKNELLVPTNSIPAQNSFVAGSTPTINWDDVSGASSYRVRIYDGWEGTVYMSDYLSVSEYTVPADTLELGKTYSYRIYAFRESGEIDNFSIDRFYPNERYHFTTMVDTDIDGMPDDWEAAYGVSDAGDDQDSDGLTNLEEFQHGTHPAVADTEGDGMDDHWEVTHSLNPLVDDAGLDPDGDGFTNLQEFQTETNPRDEADVPSLTEFHVGGPGADDANVGNDQYPLATLHEAIARINSLDDDNYTIHLASGTYRVADGEDDGQIVLDHNVTIVGSGLDTILDGTGAVNWTTGLMVSVGAPNVALRDLTIQNFSQGIVLTLDGGCVNIEGVAVELCTVGLRLVESYQVDVNLNDTLISACGTGIEILAGSSNNLIRNGVVEGNTYDGILVDACAEAPDDNLLEGIHVINNGQNGIALLDGAGNSVFGCVISGNNTTMEGYGGIAVLTCCSSLHQNEIKNNGCYGVIADDILSTQPLDATNNWWGDASGPEHPDTNPDGSGNAVSDNVIYDPWAQLGPSCDSDFDNLCDDWEIDHLGSMEYGPLDDPDCDGWSNMDEYVAGTDPDDASSYPADTVLYVGGPGASDDNTGTQDLPLATLHSAIARISSLGDDNYTIYLAAGIFSLGNGEVDEPLTIDHNLVLIGEGSDTGGTVLDGAGASVWTSGLIFSAGVSNVTLQGVAVMNFEQGLVFSTEGGCVRLEDVIVTGCGTGLQLVENYQSDFDMAGTTISSCGTGIEVLEGGNNTIRNGVVENNTGDGIMVDAEGNLIQGVYVLDNVRNGIALYGGSGNEVFDCVISGNNTGGSGYGGVGVLTCCTSINRNIIGDNQCSGVYADEVSSIEISGNLITGSAEGIKLGFTSDVTVASNTITENQEGLLIEEGSLPEVVYNIIWGNQADGTDLVVLGNYEKLEYNDIGTTNLPGLSETNISMDPVLNDATAGDYSLANISPCIDATDITEAGKDLNGLARPQGNTWDMGAYEYLGYADVDGNGLPDWWENDYFGTTGVDPSGDDDDDDLTNLEEYQYGTVPTDSSDSDGDGLSDGEEVKIYFTDPNNPDTDGDGMNDGDEVDEGRDPIASDVVMVSITHPAIDIYSTEAPEITLQGTSSIATGITIKQDGDEVETLTTGLESWSSTVSLNVGTNVIEATATDGASTDTDSVTVTRRAPADPTVSIVIPEGITETGQGTYATTLGSITLTGGASDDSQVASVTWSCSADPSVQTASGTSSWTAASITLQDGENVVTITAWDPYENSGSASITIVYTPEVTHEDTDQTPDDPPVLVDPLDVDGDGYLNADETAPGCGTDPSDSTSVPDNYGDKTYPADYSDQTKVGYFWPDCLHPDDDQDGMPDDWEDIYSLNSLDPSDAIEDPDEDGVLNLDEYLNSTDPKVAEVQGFTLTVLDPNDFDVYQSWLPGYGQSVKVRAKWDGTGDPPGQVVFSLMDTSSYPGRAVNDPDPAYTITNYPSWYQFNGPDFGLTTEDPSSDIHSFDQGPVYVSDAGDGTYTIYLQCWDYGGRTRVVVSHPNDPDARAEMWVPEGSGVNGIGSAWDYDNDPNTANLLEPNNLNANEDVDKTILEKPGSYTTQSGDGFNNFEEYRGIVYTPVESAQLAHNRLNPYRKDLFIRAAGFDAEYPFAIGNAFEKTGIDIHNTTGWGHDATEDGSFFTYYRGKGVTDIKPDDWGLRDNVVVTGDESTNWSVSWPKHEWEFKLDSSDTESAWTPIAACNGPNELFLDFPYPLDPATTSEKYSIRMPLPHLNVLIVWNDAISKGALPGQDGFIKLQYDSKPALEPSQKNPQGTRLWTWSTKGYARTNSVEDQVSMYGIAVTIQNAIHHYFNDRPYQKVSVWNEVTKTWDFPVDGDLRLMPLSKCEDPGDWGEEEFYVDGYSFDIAGIAVIDPSLGIVSGNDPDTNWDGDRRLLTHSEWDSSGQLTPFDIDGDGIVELPFASNPENIDPSWEQDDQGGQYTKARVIKHIITHEIGHALGGPDHSKDPACVMNHQSVDWKRDDHLCDWYRSLLKVHNITRYIK